MGQLDHLFHNNRRWADEVRTRDPEFFERLSRQQAPEYLWIGCSDSRVPANTIIGLPPGEIFVHRNLANMVKHSDLNCLSVMQFAIDVLQVKHVIICGHYGCAGVKASLSGDRLGLSDNWLGQMRDIREKHGRLLDDCESEALRLDRLCELNVVEQVGYACQTTVVQDAWRRGQALTLHGWVYGLEDGLLHDLHVSTPDPETLNARLGAIPSGRAPLVTDTELY
ncbi:carbonate dehydratase [Undibacterium arcticum]|uniref:carbonic anhydrase n=1 Tax=Undibacterium arcticum TaxID=1762892 RepID=A0ABV7EWU7_9BURK